MKAFYPTLFICFLGLLAHPIYRFCTGDADLWLLFAPEIDSEYYTDKVIWITGASSGIGEYLAYELAGRNAKLVLSGRRVDDLERVRDSCNGKYTPLVLPFDMTDLKSHSTVVDEVVDSLSNIDFLILNAGRTQRSIVGDTDFETIRSIMELNFFSTISLTKLVLPFMLKQSNGGHIIVTSSFSGRSATPISATYAASKHALHGFYNSLFAEYANRNIRVTIACPGPVVSEIGKHAIIKNSGDNYNIQTSEKRTPTARCAYLMAKGIANELLEVWITPQTILTLMYINQYAPFFYNKFLKYMGPARVEVFKEGGDDYDIGQVIKKIKKR